MKNKTSLLFIYLLFGIIYFNILGTTSNLIQLSVLAWVFLVVTILMYLTITRESFSFSLFYFLLFFLFSLGQVLLVSFSNFSFNKSLLSFTYVSEHYFVLATKYSLVSIYIYSFFHLLFYKQSNKKIVNKYQDKDVLKYSGILLVLLGFLPYLYRSYKYIINASNFGYAYLYSQDGAVPSIFVHLSNFYFVGLIFLVLYYVDQKKYRNILYMINVISVVPFLISGKRTDTIALILTLILIHNYYVKRFEIKSIFKYFIMFSLLMFIVGSIAIIRVSRGMDLDTFLVFIKEKNYGFGFIFDTILELGFSMGPTIAIMGFVDNGYILSYGKTYIYSILSVVPLIPKEKINRGISLANWLTDTLNLSFGSGFSLIAESYLNFKEFGFIFFAFLGIFTANIFSRFNKDNIVKSSMLFIIFRFVVISPRDSFLVFIRTFAYIVLPTYMLIMFLRIVRNSMSYSNDKREYINE